jgi:hypothetical protein
MFVGSSCGGVDRQKISVTCVRNARSTSIPAFSAL